MYDEFNLKSVGKRIRTRAIWHRGLLSIFLVIVKTQPILGRFYYRVITYKSYEKYKSYRLIINNELNLEMTQPRSDELHMLNHPKEILTSINSIGN